MASVVRKTGGVCEGIPLVLLLFVSFLSLVFRFRMAYLQSIVGLSSAYPPLNILLFLRKSSKRFEMQSFESKNDVSF